jgi:hypothetical protein
VDDASRVRQEVEADRISAELAARFGDVPPELIDADVRAEFDRRSSYKVKDFLPIFVERSVRWKLRNGKH